MLQNAKGIAKGVFYLVFSLCFTSLILKLVSSDKYTVSWLIACTLISLAVMAGMYLLINHFNVFIEKKYYWVLAIWIAIFAIVQIVIGFKLRYVPAYDLEAIYGGAIEWVETGTFANHAEYFQYFPNNLGGLTFLYVFFSLANKLGIKDYFAVATIVNCFCLVLMMFLSSEISRKLFGKKYGIFTMAFFSISLPFYSMAAVFYSDSLSMLFPVLLFYIYLHIKETDSNKRLWILALCLGLVVAVGMKIKFTVVVMLIAIFIDCLFDCKIKKSLITMGASLIVIFILSTCFNAFMYQKHLDKTEAMEKNTPYTHWVMMGLKDEGRYNPDDYNFTRSFTDQEERNKAIKEEIFNRIKTMKLSGLIDHVSKKSAIAFSDGTYCSSDFLDDSPVTPNSLHDYILYDSKHAEGYRHICEGVLIAILFLMTASGYQMFVLNKKKMVTVLVPKVAVFGMLLFLMLWETNARYITNYMPIIFLSGVSGLDFLKSGICSFRSK